MRSNTVRVAGGVAVVVVAIVLLVVLKDSGGSGDTNTTNGRVPVIVVKNGKPAGGVRVLTYNKGDRIRFKVDSDVGDEIHVHGYDVMRDIEAGGSVSFDFPATLEGVFEAELENRKEQIVELRVNP